MFRWIERILFFITQKVALLIVLLALFLIGFLVYKNISQQYFDTKNTLNIKLSQYQDSIQSQKQANNPAPTSATQNQKALFNAHVQNITRSLMQLPDADIDKTDLNQKIKLLVEMKSYSYPQNLQLIYVESLAKLTQGMIKMSQKNVSVDGFLEWYDREFARQVEGKNRHNTSHLAGVANMNIFAILPTAGSVFVFFIIILAILRIEKNTRKS